MSVRSVRDAQLRKLGIAEGASAGSGADIAQKLLAQQAQITLATTNPGTGADLEDDADANNVTTGTAANFNAVGHAVNTAASKVAGRQGYVTDTGNTVYAVSDAAAGLWVDSTGATVHTPV